jgi:hypothetical protein
LTFGEPSSGFTPGPRSASRLLIVFVYASPHSPTFLKFQFLFVYFVIDFVAMSKMEAWCHMLSAQLHMELNDNDEND